MQQALMPSTQKALFSSKLVPLLSHYPQKERGKKDGDSPQV